MRNRIAIALVLIAGGLPTYALPCAGEDIPLPPGLAGYQLADCNDVKWYRVTIPWAGRLSWIVSPGLVWGSGPDVQFTVYKDPATCTGANVATTCARADDVQTRLDVDVLAPGTYYAVATCCPSGHLGDGHFVLQVIFDCDRPDPPTGVTATKGSYPDKVVVTWNAVARADAYQVSRDGGTFISAWQAALSYTDTNVWNCEIHSYQVRAKQSVCGAGGEGISWSDADTGYITPPNPVFAPTGVTASANPVCAGSTVTLTAQGGSGGTYTWYYGNCCGDPICRLGQGNPLQIAAWVTNTYAVRIESVACGNSDCASITMQVSREPVAPMSAQASSNPACPGSQVTLTAAGGSGTYEWYANHCGTENGGTHIGSGNPLQIIAPAARTTYFVRTESSPCNSSACVQVDLLITPDPQAPAGAWTGLAPFCAGAQATLQTFGGSGGTYTWYADGCGNGSPIGTGDSIQITVPVTDTTYYVRTEGLCANSACQSVVLPVTSPPVMPAAATATPNPACAGSLVTLTAQGGSGGDFHWWTDCAAPWAVWGYVGNPVQIVAPASDTTYYVWMRSVSCGVSTCLPVVLRIISDPVAPTGATANANPVCTGTPVTLTAQGGSGGTYEWYAAGCGTQNGGAHVGSGNPLRITAPAAPTTYFVRTEGLCVVSACARVDLQIISNPVAPTGATASSNPAYAGSQVTLTAQGGSNGTYEWYATGCGTQNGGAHAGSGNPLQITAPAAPTTYFVRTEGSCGASACARVDVQIATPPVAPTVTTAAASNVTPTTAQSGGNVASDGGAAVTVHGVCWSTAAGPTIADSHTLDGVGTGSFTSSFTGLIAGTTYYIRAYATNAVGTGYGSEVAFATTAPAAPDFHIAVALSSDAAAQTTFSVNDQITFLVTVENAGNGGGSGVVLTIPVPPGMELVSAQVLPAGVAAPGQVTADAAAVRISVGDVAAGAHVRVELVLRALNSGHFEVQCVAECAEQAGRSSPQTAAELNVEDAYYVIVGPRPWLPVCGAVDGALWLTIAAGLIGTKGWLRTRRRRSA